MRPDRLRAGECLIHTHTSQRTRFVNPMSSDEDDYALNGLSSDFLSSFLHPSAPPALLLSELASIIALYLEGSQKATQTLIYEHVARLLATPNLTDEAVRIAESKLLPEVKKRFPRKRSAEIFSQWKEAMIRRARRQGGPSPSATRTTPSSVPSVLRPDYCSEEYGPGGDDEEEEAGCGVGGLTPVVLPPEVLCRVFELSDPRSVIRAGAACRYFRDVQDDTPSSPYAPYASHLWRTQTLFLTHGSRALLPSSTQESLSLSPPSYPEHRGGAAGALSDNPRDPVRHSDAAGAADPPMWSQAFKRVVQGTPGLARMLAAPGCYARVLELRGSGPVSLRMSFRARPLSYSLSDALLDGGGAGGAGDNSLYLPFLSRARLSGPWRPSFLPTEALIPVLARLQRAQATGDVAGVREWVMAELAAYCWPRERAQGARARPGRGPRGSQPPQPQASPVSPLPGGGVPRGLGRVFLGRSEPGGGAKGSDGASSSGSDSDSSEKVGGGRVRASAKGSTEGRGGAPRAGPVAAGSSGPLGHVPLSGSSAGGRPLGPGTAPGAAPKSGSGARGDSSRATAGQRGGSAGLDDDDEGWIGGPLKFWDLMILGSGDGE